MLCCRAKWDDDVCCCCGIGGAPLSCGHLGSCRRLLVNTDGVGDGVVARMLWDLDSLDADAEEETNPEAMSRR